MLKDRYNCCNFAHTKTRHHESIHFIAIAYCIGIVIV